MNIFARIASLWGTGQTEEQIQAESERLDRALEQENRADAGRYGPEWAREVEENLDRDTPDAQGSRTVTEDAAESIGDEFDASLAESTAGYRQAIGTPIWALLRTVPAIVWIGLALFIAWQLGAFTWIKSRVAKSA